MPVKRTVIVLSFLASLCRFSWSDELVEGPWKATFGPTGPTQITYDNLPVLTQGALTGFKPGWASHRFSMDGCRVEVKQEDGRKAIVWEKSQPGVFSARVSLRLSADRLQWELELETGSEGPVEFGILVPWDTVRTSGGAAYVAAANAVREAYDEEELTGLSGQRFKFLLPRFDLVFATSASGGSWLLQDRHLTSLKAFRPIWVASADGRAPLKATARLALTIQKHSPAEQAEMESLFSQRARVFSHLTVVNAGFEGDAEGWTMPPNARIVEDGASEGKRCAELALEREDESPYITQRVPIVPSARYRATAMVKAAGVRKAKPLKMSSVGATLIVEWADKDKKWLASGQYAKSIFGDSGWQRLECDSLLAPKDAAYAIIFLALRGLGTAWFDDVRMSEVRRQVRFKEPLDGATVRNNRPALRWLEDPDAEEYEVELSPQPNFQGEGVMRGRCTEPSFTPDKPLAPGTWFWRVAFVGDQPRSPWSFRQTAPADADTSPPTLSLASQSLTGSDEPLVVRYADPSGVRADSVSVVIGPDEPPLKQGVSAGPSEARIIPPGGWQRAVYWVTVNVADSRGNEGRMAWPVVCAPAPPAARRWTADAVLENETPTFPLGIYQIKPENMKRVKDAGFDLIHNYQFEGSQDDQAARSYLDAAHAAGLKAFVGFDRGRATGQGLCQSNVAHVANRIAALRDHPALHCWYLFDEPDLSHQYVAPRNLTKLYRLVKALDPYHPVVVTFASDLALKRYSDCMDVHWTQVYGTTEHVANRLAKHRADLGQTPLTAIVHCYDREMTEALRAKEKIDVSKFQPDRRMMRANALMAIAHGSAGLFWWWYGDGQKTIVSAGDVPEAWDWLTSVVQELRELRPLLVKSPKLPVRVTCDPEDAKVHAAAWQTDRGLLLIAVNPALKPAQAAVTVVGLPAPAKAIVRGENRELPVQAGAVADSFDPLGAHVYVVAK